MFAFRSSFPFRCEMNRLRCFRIKCDNQFNRMYSSHVTFRLTNCLANSNQRQLFNLTTKHRTMDCDIFWSSRASISSSVSSSSSGSSSFSSQSTDIDLGPLNLSQIADELGKLSNAGKTGSSPNVAQDSVSITDVDLTEFTSPIDLNDLPETLLTASDIGLTWFAPTNIIFKSLMAIHEQLPWWGSIAALTLCLRLLLFPLMIRNMKSTSNISKNVKDLEACRAEFKSTIESGNHALQVKSAVKLLDTMKKNQLTVLKSITPMLGMGVVFSSCFFAIRGMANYPIESMKIEGLSWFNDLTIPDPYFVLPTLTSLTLYYVITNGNETVPVDPLSAKAIRFMPLVLCPIVIIVGASFPAALNTYWLTNNLISLGQGFILRKTKLREILEIPDPAKATQEMSKSSLESTVEMQKDIQLAAKLVKEVYEAKMNKDIKLKAAQMKQDKNA